jgi:glycerol-3-phosphate dehydrogenase subunit C
LSGVKYTEYSVPPDLDEIKKQLRQQRLASIENIQDLMKEAFENLNKVKGMTAQKASDAKQAATFIKQIVGTQTQLDINNSGTVDEVSKELEKLGIQLKKTYYSEGASVENIFEHFWQQPALKYQPVEDSFAINHKLRLNGSDKDYYENSYCLLGANAISAEDGSIYFLQHSSNIEKMSQYKNIIIIAGIEKIVATQQEAEFQTKWAGNFGLSSMLLNIDLNKGETAHEIGTDGIEKKNDQHTNQRQVNVILIDNGRLRILDTPFKETLLCISCRSCLQHCPTYKFFGKDIGRYPQQYLYSFLTGANPSVDLCVSCGNCATDCPVGINLTGLLIKAKGLKKNKFTLGEKVLANPEILGKLSRLGGPISNSMTRNKIVRKGMEISLGLHRNRQIPEIKKNNSINLIKGERKNKTIIYYPGCYAAYFETDIANAAIKLLTACGYNVIIPTFKCCGIPLFSVGNIDAGINKANKIIDILSQDNYKNIDIVTTCPSCRLSLKYEYKSFNLKGSQCVAERVYDIEEYLIKLYENKKNIFNKTNQEIAYHLPCHMRAQGLEELSIKFLSMVPNLSVFAVNRGCCGMSGTFGEKKKYFDYSMEIGKPLFDAINSSNTELVCTECGPCKMQIVQGTSKKTLHPIVLFASLLDDRNNNLYSGPRRGSGAPFANLYVK